MIKHSINIILFIIKSNNYFLLIYRLCFSNLIGIFLLTEMHSSAHPPAARISDKTEKLTLTEFDFNSTAQMSC